VLILLHLRNAGPKICDEQLSSSGAASVAIMFSLAFRPESASAFAQNAPPNVDKGLIVQIQATGQLVASL
jgi:hypothetical protein